jgi:hypothetical protein
LKILLLLLILWAPLSFGKSCSTFKSQFDEQQMQTLIKSYQYGLAYDMELTLTAMAWTESSAGKKLGSGDPAFGVYQAYLPTIRNRLNLPIDHIVTSHLSDRLKEDESFYTAHAITELLFWKKKRKIWWNVWASYNGGYRFDQYMPQKYALKIYQRTKEIHECRHLFEILPFEFNFLDSKTFALVKSYSGISVKNKPNGLFLPYHIYSIL